MSTAGDDLQIKVSEASKTWKKTPATVISTTTVRDAKNRELATVKTYVSDEDGAIVVDIECTELGEQYPLRTYIPDHAS